MAPGMSTGVPSLMVHGFHCPFSTPIMFFGFHSPTTSERRIPRSSSSTSPRSWNGSMTVTGFCGQAEGGPQPVQRAGADPRLAGGPEIHGDPVRLPMLECGDDAFA